MRVPKPEDVMNRLAPDLRLRIARLKARIFWKIYKHLTATIARFARHAADEYPTDPVISICLAKIGVRSSLLGNALRKFRG